MCAGMCTRCPAPGTSVSSRSACGTRALGRLRRFDGVNVVVIRARMIRIALHHALERRDDRVGAGLRRAVLRVEPPRPQVHQALRIQRGDVEIVGKLLRQLAHRIRVRLFAHGLIAGRIGDVALRQRVDQALLDVAAGGLALLRFGEMRVAPASADRPARCR